MPPTRLVADQSASRKVIEDYIDAAKGGTHGSSRRQFQDRRIDRRSELLEVLKLQYLATESLNHLTTTLKPHCDGVEEVGILLGDTQRGTVGVLEWIITQLDWNPLITVPSHASSQKAQEVFNTTELAEIILSLLSIADILSAATANRAFTHCVSSSKKLQDILCLRPDQDSFWRSNFQEGGDLDTLVSCGISGPFRSKWKAREEMNIDAQIFRQPLLPFSGEGPEVLPSSGSRCQSMLICQPPIKELWAVPQCCGTFEERNLRYGADFDGKLPPPPEPLSIRSDTGLTLGDLVSFADKISEDHRQCPYGAHWHHDDATGECVPEVIFKGTLVLRPDDPALPGADFSGYTSPYIDDEIDYSERYRKGRGLTELDKYIEAKQQGKLVILYSYISHANVNGRLALLDGDPVPTMTDFRESRNYSEEKRSNNESQRNRSVPRRYNGGFRRTSESESDSSDLNNMTWPGYHRNSYYGRDRSIGNQETGDDESNVKPESRYNTTILPIPLSRDIQLREAWQRSRRN